MINVKLSLRLQAIADLVPFDSTILDVGTDHGYLPIYLALTGKCFRAYASDLRKEPLALAIKNIKAYNLETKIIPILCDGIANNIKDANVLIIAGMGKDNVINILEKADLKPFKKLILQVNKKASLLRAYLAKKRYLISDEKVVYDGKRYYEIIVVEPHKIGFYNNFEILFGPQLLKNNSPLTKKYWEELVNKWQTIQQATKTDKFIDAINFILPYLK